MLSICCNSRVKFQRNKKETQKVTKIKLFIYEYNWEGINVPSEKDDWKKFEKNNLTIALNVLYAKKGKNISCLCFKHNSNHEKQVIILMTSNGERLWHYFALKKLSALLTGTTSKYNGDFCCLNCFLSFATEKKLHLHYAF